MSILQRRVLGIRLRVWMLLVMFLPVLLWGILNVFFSTPWGTGYLEKKIGKRIGMECQIESVTWSPWAGVVIRDFSIPSPSESKQETDMVSIEEIQIDPSWNSLFDGKKRWERLEVRKMEAEISIEMIKMILARYEKPATGGLVVAKEGGGGEKPTPPPKSTGEGTKPDVGPGVKPGVEPGGGDHTNRPPVVNQDEKSGRTPDEALAESVPVDDFEGAIVFSDARIRLYSEKVPILSMTLDDLDGEIPLWGAAREGEVAVGLVQLGERFAERSLTIPVKWENRSLDVTNHSLKLFGLDIRLSAAVLLHSGYPVGLQVELPEQQIDLSSVFPDRDSPLEVASLKSQNLLQGYLGSPTSFQGQSTMGFENIVFHDLMNGGETKFSRGSSKIKFSAAGLVAEDIRIVGDDDAILMNGFATTGGEMAATVRIVSSPERAWTYENRVKRSGPDHTLDFQDLVTPDRKFRDIRIEARSGALMMDLGEGRSWVPFFQGAKGILGRKNIELPNLP